jgi:hypothetical protein
MLRVRDRPGDRDRASHLAGQALEAYRELGMDSYAERLRALA